MSINRETFFRHESAFIDEPCSIGTGTKIWHFSHIMSDCTIGDNCNIGQNVVISPQVVLGNNVKVQNNVLKLPTLLILFAKQLFKLVVGFTR
jgi:UDP-2-acetamido-3-amino-2,3-dideoxy-glucuronate N-acetyltransferase